MHELISATYHNGVLVPAVPLSLPEGTQVKLTVEPAPVAEPPAVRSLIVKLERGPCLADRPRLSIYPIYEYLIAGHDREKIQQVFELTDAQFEAVRDYVAEHQEEVEQAYAGILRREAEMCEHYEKIFWERSPYPPDMPWAEKEKLLRQEYARRKQAGLIPSA